jgi:hypothetical protein
MKTLATAVVCLLVTAGRVAADSPWVLWADVGGGAQLVEAFESKITCEVGRDAV